MKSLLSILLLVCTVSLSAVASPANDGPQSKSLGKNIALGCKYTYDKKPEYPFTRDDGDITQLTDGQYVSGHFWTQKDTVGWGGASPIVITIDLGKVQPISGISYSTAAGAATVEWPNSIMISASEDGHTWRYVGDLVRYAMKNGLPEAGHYSTYRYVTHDFKSRGRYVRLAVLSQSSYMFCDEIEVYRGPDSFLSGPSDGEVISDMKEFILRTASQRGVVGRLSADIAAARTAVKSSKLSDAEKSGLLKTLNDAERAIPHLPEPNNDKFQAILPLNDLHASIMSIYAPIMRSQGLPVFFAWKKHRYDPLTPNEIPHSTTKPASVAISMMGNEHRADSILLTNASAHPISARLKAHGLPGGSRPSWLTVSSVPWTDTTSSIAIASALPDAKYANGAYEIPIPAGMTRKIWLAVDSTGIKPGQYNGTLLVTGAKQPVSVPFRLRVSSVQMGQPRLSLGVWDYTSGKCAYGITLKNRDEAIKLMKSHFVDSPWGGSDVLPMPTADAFDANGQLKSPLSFAQFDAWVNLWKGARHYLVFANVPDNFAGTKMGTPEFAARVGSWAKALSNHMRGLKLEPGKLSLLLVDEPFHDWQDEIIVPWAKAIRAATPELTIWQNPAWQFPHQTKHQEAITLADELSPNLVTFYDGGPDVVKYYDKLRAEGKKQWFYMCDGPVKIFDPQRYFRLISWYAFKHDVIGVGFWAFSDTGGAKDTWNEYAATATPYCPAFLGVDSATDSIHWQAVREGIEDYEYLAMLKDAAKRTNDAALRSQAESLLSEAVGTVTSDTKVTRDWTEGINRSVVDDYRTKVLSLLEKMSGK